MKPEQEEQTLRGLTCKCNIEPKNRDSYASSVHTSHTKHTVPDLSHVCKNHTTFKLQWRRIGEKKIAVDNSDKPMTLKQGHGDQTWCKSVDPLQDCNNAKFQNPCMNTVHDVANDKGFVKSGNTSIISIEYVQKLKTVVY